MGTQLSRSEQKRRSKGVEHLVQELVNLSKKDIKSLPCDDFYKEEMIQATSLKGGSRKRQVKYIAKGLRKDSDAADQLLDFMQEKKGSQLKQNQEFQEVERLRDAILNSVIALNEEAMSEGRLLDVAELSRIQIPVLQEIVADLPDIDKNAMVSAAWQYAKSRKPGFSREIFRMIKAAREKLQFVEKMNT